VIDDEVPSIICAADQSQTADPGLCQAAVTVIPPINADNCGVATLINDYNGTADASDNYPVGTTTITWTVTDVNGNSNTCTQDITVTDDENPTITCAADQTQTADPGVCQAAVTVIAPVTADNCSVASVTNDFNGTADASDTYPVGTTTVTWTVTDAAGLTATCMQDITVTDDEDPIAVCMDITIGLDISGNASIIGADIDGGSTDNCSIDTLIANPNTFTFVDLGTNNVTLTVTDVNGNSSTCIAIVTVADTIPPTAICQDTTIYLDATGNVSIDPTYIDNGSFDNAGIDSMWISVDAFDCSTIVGPQSVTLTVRDLSGNESTCTSNVTVLDTITPTLTCQDINLYLDASGSASIVPSDVIAAFNDNCPNPTMVIDLSNFTCADVGANNVSATISDDSGNSSFCVAVVTVIDTIRPMVICQDIDLYLDINGLASITVPDIDNGSNDACGIATMILSQYDYDCSMIGANPVTLTVTDNNGNIDSCLATVTLHDTINPTMVCSPLTVYLDVNGQFTITPADIDGGSSDACGIDTLYLNQYDLTCAEVPSVDIWLTAIDVNGNIDSCLTSVVVVDTINPEVLCQNIDLYLDATGLASISVVDIDNGSNDACGLDTLYLSQYNYDCSLVGNNQVTLFVIDNNGNLDSCWANVNVIDSIIPVVICQDIDLYLDINGLASISVPDIDNGSNDACGLDTLYLSQYDYDCSMIGANPVTLTVIDNNGNIDSCLATVTLHDTINPTMVCSPLTVYLDVNGQFTITPADIDGGSSDACGIDTLYLNQYDLTCAEVASVDIWLTAIDVNGNIDSCLTSVVVVDTINPEVLCMSIDLYLDVNGDASITPLDIDNGSNDACGIDTLYLSQYDYDCSMRGINPITLYAVDVNGNLDSCLATVNVIDTIAPVAMCQDTTIYLDGNGQFTIDVSFLENGSSDACGIDTTYLDQYDFDCSMIGLTNTVTYFVADSSGNIGTCTSIITVLDTISPIVIADTIDVYLDVNGIAGIIGFDLDNGSTDNCQIDTYVVSQDQFDCSDVGAVIDTLFVTDIYGNMSYAVGQVNVIDSVAPEVLCQNLTVELYIDGNVFITVDSLDIGSNDACGIDTLYLSQYEFGCEHVGDNFVTLYAIDVNGNIDSCISVVTVEDNIFPDVDCTPDVVQNNDPGLCGGQVTTIPPVTSDYCGVETVVNSFNGTDNASDFYPVGITVVTWTVTDVNANVSTCEQTITIIDNELPTIICPADIDICNENVIVDQPQVADNCAVDLFINDYNGSADASDTYPIAADLNVDTTVVVWTVTDINGNSASCSMDIVVWNFPTVSDAGEDDQFCEDPSTIGDMTILEANTPLIGIGEWTVLTGPGVVLDPFNPGSIVDNLQYGSNELLWTISNGVCVPSESTVEIIVDQLPTVADAGEDKITSLDEHYLDANLPTVGTGMWTVEVGTGTFYDPENPGTLVTALGLGQNYLAWTITNGTCPASIDTVIYDLRDFSAPQGFSPNGDGVNDYFELLDLERYPDASLRVYNRWGAEVYSSDHYQNDWDGRATTTIFGDGVLPAGTYFYIVDLKNGKGPFTGYVYIKP
jgi:gliding motility-associated-like protein